MHYGDKNVHGSRLHILWIISSLSLVDMDQHTCSRFCLCDGGDQTVMHEEQICP